MNLKFIDDTNKTIFLNKKFIAFYHHMFKTKLDFKLKIKKCNFP